MFWQAVDSLLVNDLVGPGDVFSMEKCAGAFVDAPLMNNGSTLDYEVEVDFYDPETREAIVTVRKIRYYSDFRSVDYSVQSSGITLKSC